jgi:hypothetical protein
MKKTLFHKAVFLTIFLNVFLRLWLVIIFKSIVEPQMRAHCNENPIYVFLFWELRDLSPNFYICVSVSDLYIPRIGPPTCFLQQNSQIDRGNTVFNRSQTHACGNWDCGRTIPFLGIFVSNFQLLVLCSAGQHWYHLNRHHSHTIG